MQHGAGRIEGIRTSQTEHGAQAPGRIEQTIIDRDELKKWSGPQCRIGPGACVRIACATGNRAPHLQQQQARRNQPHAPLCDLHEEVGGLTMKPIA